MLYWVYGKEVTKIGRSVGCAFGKRSTRAAGVYDATSCYCRFAKKPFQDEEKVAYEQAQATTTP